MQHDDSKDLEWHLAAQDKRLAVLETKVDLMGDRMSTMSDHSAIQAKAVNEMAVSTAKLEQRITSGQWWMGLLLSFLTLAVSATGAIVAMYTGIFG